MSVCKAILVSIVHHNGHSVNNATKFIILCIRSALIIHCIVNISHIHIHTYNIIRVYIFYRYLDFIQLYYSYNTVMYK